MKKYTYEILTKLNISYRMFLSEDTMLPNIVVEQENDIYVTYETYKTTMTDIENNNAVDMAIDQFIKKLRKEKLKQLQKIS